MLTFESPFYEYEGIVIFRDHAVPTLFHYLAGPPRLTRGDDGKPHLLLLKYRHAIETIVDDTPTARDELGGGFLMFGVDCGIDQDIKDTLIRKLQAQMPPGSSPVSLVPVLYTKGTVQVLALDAQSPVEPPPDDSAGSSADTPASRFVRGILGTATPSLLQDQRAIFSIALTPDGATLLEEAYESELSPIGVMYSLEFAGLRPALGVKVKADLKKVYSKFSIEFGIDVGSDNQSILDVDIGYVLEKLKQDGAVEVQIVRQQEGAAVAEMEKQAMALLKETLLADMFRPAASSQPRTPSAGEMLAQTRAILATANDMNQGSSGEGSGNISIGFQLKYLEREELKTITFNYDVAAPETRIHAPNGFFSALVSDSEKANHIRTVDLDDPWWRTLSVDVIAPTDFERLDLQTAVVDLQYGGTTDDPVLADTVAFSADDTATKVFQAAREHGFSYRYRIGYAFGGSDDIDAQSQSHESDWRTTTRRSLVVHPAEDVAMLRVWIEAGVVDWDLVDTIEVRLSYGSEEDGDTFHPARVFSVTAESERQQWLVRLSDHSQPTYQVRTTWHLKNHTIIHGETEDRTARQLFVPDPFTNRIRVTVDPQVDPARIARVLVHLAYEDEDNDFAVEKTVELFGPDFRSQKAELPILDPQNDRYDYTVSLVPIGGGDAVQRGPFTTDSRYLVIDGDGLRFDVRFVLLGDLAASGFLGIQIDAKGEPPDGMVVETQSHLFQPGGDSDHSFEFLLRDDQAPQISYRITLFDADGDTTELDWETWDRTIKGINLASLLDD